ncbi:MAG: NUMOD3 domain-containing DNA-binding protein [Steroidobacteraceae bacterium]
MRGFVYILTFSDGKQYVGQTRRSVDERMKEHRYDMGRGINRKLYKAWRLMGDPTCEVIECAAKEVNDLECFVIDWLDCRAPNGLNAIPGGGFLPQLDPVIAARIAETHRTQPHLLAKIRKAQSLRWVGTTPEQRSAFMRDKCGHHKPHSAETKAKMSASRKGKGTGPKSPEHAAKVGAANRGKKRSLESIERIRASASRAWEFRRLNGTAIVDVPKSPETIERMRQAALRRWSHHQSTEMRI